MSFKGEVSVFGEDCDAHGWHDNALRFATKEEADKYVFDLSMRWLAVKDFRSVESPDPVTHKIVDGVLMRVDGVVVDQ